MFTLTIETDGAAFSDDDPEDGEYTGGYGAQSAELARILRALADRFDDLAYESGPESHGTRVFDVYGNTCGSWKLS